MAQRDVTTRFGANTSGFSQGVSEVVAQLDKYNKALVDNQQQIKQVNREISELEKEQRKLKSQMENGGTEEQKKELAELTEKIEQHRVVLAQLRTDQTQIKNAISETSEELKKEGQEVGKTSEGFTVLKGAISNLVSDALNVAIDKFKEMSVSAEQSLNALQVKTGMSAEAVGELKDEMYDIYKNNFGDSLTDVADKMALVTQNINESDPEKIKEITEKAIGLSDAFGSDFEENLRGVNGLMVNMGLSAEEAFDLIAKGSQNGLDKTHELTDNLAEYTQIWGQAGFSAQEMFSILQNGLDSGAYTLDKVNDFVKEFSISLSDGRIAENINSFSQRSKELFDKWKSGSATQAEVFQSIISDLSNMTNKQEALTIASNTWSALGEDNAMSVITALNNVNDTYNDVAGTMQEINDIQYDDVGSQIEALGRQFEVDILQPIVEGITPNVKNLISWVSDHLPEVTSTLTGIITTLVTLKTSIGAVTTAQKLFNVTASANPYVFLASAILSVVAGLASWNIAINANSSAVKSETEEIKNYTQALDDAKSSAEEKKTNAESEIALLNSQKERYDELRQKVNLTAQEKNELNNIASDIAKTLGTTTQAIKDESGAYKELSGSVEEYIGKLRAKIEAESVQDILKEAYTSKNKIERELNEVNKQIAVAKSAIGGFDGTENIEDNEQNQAAANAAGYSVSQLNFMVDKWKELTRQQSYAEETIEEYSNKLSESYKNLGNANKGLGETISNTEQATQATKDLAEAMSDMSAKTNAVTKAEEEYNESGRFTVATIQAVIDKYPELEDEVNKYILGIIDEKELIQSMKNVYQDDLNSYIGVISQKASNSNTFYNQLINANTAFVNDAKAKYGIDLMNFKNLQEAKEAMVAKTASNIQGPTQMYTGSFDKPVLYNQPNKESWQYKAAESIVNDFIGSAISATTNYQNFFSPSSSNNRSGGSTRSGSTSSSSSKDNKYDLASEAYNHLVDKRIEKIEKEAEAAEKAKDRKIAAINAEIEARKRLNEDADRQAELDEINARLEYDQLSKLDRRELERKRQDLLNEQAQINWERMMSDKKDKIESDYSRQGESYSNAIEALQQAARSAENYFNRLAGTQTSSQIVNNNSDIRNIQIIANALSNEQMLAKLMNALYSK